MGLPRQLRGRNLRMPDAAQVRTKLKNDQPSIGGWMQIPDDNVAEIMGAAGYDWVAVDLEQGFIDFAAD